MPTINKLDDIDTIILCGGLGKRLRPITHGLLPKPMVNMGKGPFLDIVIERLVKFGLRHFILSVGYKSQAVINYYKALKNPAIRILYCRENHPLGTGGAVLKAARLTRGDRFFVLNGDSLCNFNPRTFLRFHENKRSKASILLKRVRNGRDYGEIKLDKDQRIKDFNEKNKHSGACFINAGVYIFEKSAFDTLRPGRALSLERDIFPGLINKGIFGCPCSGFFIDIGTPKRYLAAKNILKETNQ